jgi:stage V sporulation protein S
MTAADRNLAYDEALDPDEVIRVGGGSDPQGVASAISMAFYERHEVTLRAVGASAVNQANKAVAIARGYVATRGLDLYMRPLVQNHRWWGGQTLSHEHEEQSQERCRHGRQQCTPAPVVQHEYCRCCTSPRDDAAKPGQVDESLDRSDEEGNGECDDQ